MHRDLRHVADAAELVELHVRVDLPSGRPVHDAFFEEGVVQAHNDAAGNLRLASQAAHHEAAVLHGDHVLQEHDAGLGVHSALADLHAADLTARDVRVVAGLGDLPTPDARALRLVHAEPGTEFLPRPAL